MKKAAVGFRVHSGWAAMVAVSLEKGEPAVLCGERPHLVRIFNYSYRQPYHTAEKMGLAEAGKFIAQVEKEARELAYAAIHEIQSELGKVEIQLTRGSLLLASGRPLPDLEKILVSHALIHTADGELFREAIVHGCQRCGLNMESVKEKELLERAGASLHEQPAALLRQVTELGKPFGAPWSQDEKFATLAAWLALSGPSKKASKAPKNSPAA